MVRLVNMPMNMKKTTAKGKIERFNLLAEGLDDSLRTIRVYLPPNYDTSLERYPVLYMHDGQNLFFNRETKYKNGSWQVHKTFDHFYQQNLGGFIVVGVNSSEQDRTNELSLLAIQKRYAMKDKDSKQALGREYEKFFTIELKNYIDRHYRTNADISYIGGSSMGGISSLLIALRNPGLYQGALCFTPAGMIHYQKDIKWLFKSQIAKFNQLNIPLPKLYFMVGGVGLETIIKPFCDFAVPFLVSHGYEYNKNITYSYRSKALHIEKAWAKELPKAFIWLIE